MRKPEDVNPGVRHMALKLLELVWHKEVRLLQGPKSIRTARINLGSTPGFFDEVLEFALEQKMVYKVGDDMLQIGPPIDAHTPHQLRLGGIEQP